MKELDIFDNMKLRNAETRKRADDTDTDIYVLLCIDKDNGCIKSGLRKRVAPFYRYAKNAGYNRKDLKPIQIFYKNDLREKELIKRGLLHKDYLKYNNWKPGEWGNYLSHMKALIQFLSTDKPYCIILEDDAWMKKTFKKDIKAIEKQLKLQNVKWDLIWLYNSGIGNYENAVGAFMNMNKRRSSTPTLRMKKKDLNLYAITRKFIGSTTAYMINRKCAFSMLKNAFPMKIDKTDMYMQYGSKWKDRKKFKILTMRSAKDKKLSGTSDGYAKESPLIYAEVDDSSIQLNT
jgi:GR25 family glycosyltransferase involved in LPS biosynthesis